MELKFLMMGRRIVMSSLMMKCHSGNGVSETIFIDNWMNVMLDVMGVRDASTSLSHPPGFTPKTSVTHANVGEIERVLELLYQERRPTISDNFIAIYGTWFTRKCPNSFGGGFTLLTQPGAKGPLWIFYLICTEMGLAQRIIKCDLMTFVLWNERLVRPFNVSSATVFDPFIVYSGLSGFKLEGTRLAWLEGLIRMVEQAWLSFSHSDSMLCLVSRRNRPLLLIDKLNGPFILKEMLNWCKRKKKQAMFFKVDFAKAYEFVGGLSLEIPHGVMGDPLAPYLFILIMESLHISFSRVVDDGLFKGFQLHGSVNISHLFYADDAMFIGEAANRIGCAVLNTLFRYLGVTVGECMSRKSAWVGLVNKLQARLSKWKVKTLSIGGRLTLLKSVLGASPIYYMSIFKVPKGVWKTMESIRIFLRVESCSFGEWVWRFISGDGSLWCKVIQAIYGSKFDLHVTDQPSIWCSILREVKSLKDSGFDFSSHCKKRIGDGSCTSFWYDIWLADAPLCVQFPRLLALELIRDCGANKIGASRSQLLFRAGLA
ncbi:hypothetical protein Tco_0008014 [Tanacetum coccineum]